MKRGCLRVLAGSIALATTIVGAPMAGAQEPDTEPPQLLAFDFTPKEVTAYDGAEQVTVTMRITDETGIKESPVVNFGVDERVGPEREVRGTGNVEATLISGNTADGVWQAVLTVPPEATFGRWTAWLAPLEDRSSNRAAVEIAPRFPNELTVVPDPDADIEPPQLRSFVFDPVADTTAGPVQVTFTMHLTDKTGIDVSFSPPQVGVASRTRAQDIGAEFELISGSDSDGIWQAVVTIPANASLGTWDVTVGGIIDSAGVYGNGLGDPLTGRFPDEVMVQSSSDRDIDSPVLESFDVSPNEVFLGVDNEVTVTARITDETGVEPPEFRFTIFDSYSTFTVGGGRMELVSGTPRDGTWQVVTGISSYDLRYGTPDSDLPLVDVVGNSHLPRDLPPPLPSYSIQMAPVPNPFTDVAGNVHEMAIRRMAGADVTGGCNPDGTLYCPRREVGRAQMASFLVRAFDLPPAERNAFSDDTGSVHEDSINRLAAAGVAVGYRDGTFRPNLPVPREEMASFLVRAARFGLVGDRAFADVPFEGPHWRAIGTLAFADIVQGCNPEGTLYCPKAPVFRDQMASFLFRALEVQGRFR